MKQKYRSEDFSKAEYLHFKKVGKSLPIKTSKVIYASFHPSMLPPSQKDQGDQKYLIVLEQVFFPEK